MNKIQKLSDAVIDRIAAGEVVERPSSVVKELVENSLDAGAKRVLVQLTNGGKNRIVVDDDGRGMSDEDARLALERHATSKLTEVDDLDRIATYGFRGEALSSIAAVSNFTLTTCADPDQGGIELIISGGQLVEERPGTSARGTRIEVERIFFNVPARRKFLRADATELSHVVRLLTRAALYRHDVHFKLEHGAQTLLDVAAVETLSERVEQIFGRDRARRMLPFELESDGVRVHGVAGRPVDALPRRDAQHLFVNGRVVQDRVLMHAVSAAYDDSMPRGRYPAIVLFVDVDPHLVDVNVHPQKTEVRFQLSRQVHETVRHGVRSALQSEEAIPRYEELRPGAAPATSEPAASYPSAPSFQPTTSAPSMPTHTPVTAAPLPTPTPTQATGNWVDQMPIETTSQAMALGQYLESYIVAQDREGLLIIDQHAAHERVLYEKYLRDADDDIVERQALMFPVTIDLAPDEWSVLHAELDEFRRIGFLIEPFGDKTMRISEIPAVAGGVDPVELVRELLGDAVEARSATQDTKALRRRLITTAACQSAIKVNYPLAKPAMQRLLDDLFRVENITTCPHGRPAIFRLTQ